MTTDDKTPPGVYPRLVYTNAEGQQVEECYGSAPAALEEFMSIYASGRPVTMFMRVVAPSGAEINLKARMQHD